MRRLALALLPALALACSSPCQDLGTRVCECYPRGATRDACVDAITEQVDSGNPKPGDDDQDFCEAKLATCPDPDDDPTICDRLQTPEGKVACGLAYPDAVE